jgi:hypothetical protein
MTTKELIANLRNTIEAWDGIDGEDLANDLEREIKVLDVNDMELEDVQRRAVKECDEGELLDAYVEEHGIEPLLECVREKNYSTIKVETLDKSIALRVFVETTLYPNYHERFNYELV